MKEKLTISLLAFVFLSSSCNSMRTESHIEDTSLSIQETATSTILPTTDVDAPLLRTITPSQTQNVTHTTTPVINRNPTFNLTIVPTFTPAQSPSCPQESAEPTKVSDAIRLLEEHEEPYLDPDVRQGIIEDEIVKVLNNGAASNLYDALKSQEYGSEYLAFEDLTNDGVSEIVIVDKVGILGRLYVFGCLDGEYSLLFTHFAAYHLPRIMDIGDLNRNGVNELVVSQLTCEYCTGVYVFEWNGSSFESMIRNWYMDFYPEESLPSDFAELPGYSYAYIDDIDENGFYEILLEGGKPSYRAGLCGLEGPYREQVVVFMWDGSNYVWHSRQYYPPDFRFQAIQDADDAAYAGEYSRALGLYQEAIFSDELSSWNSERWNTLPEGKDCYPDIDYIQFNLVEYNQISAYARYRMMVLFLAQGWLQDAMVIKETMDTLFPSDNAGYPYLELADMYLDKYQSTESLDLSCEVVVLYVEQNPELLLPLGSEDHGLWTKHYTPQDVCPFVNIE